MALDSTGRGAAVADRPTERPQANQDFVRTAISARSCATAAELLEDGLARRRRDGLILEFGVYAGRSITYIAERIAGQAVFGFDSFAGLPEDWRQGFGKGAFATTMPEVPPNARLIVGLFDDTLPAFLAAHPGPVSFMHVDCDLYSSTRTVLRHCRDRIQAGTVIIFDEYFNYPGWQQYEHRAFLEFIAETGLPFEYISVVPQGEQVGVRITGTPAGP